MSVSTEHIWHTLHDPLLAFIRKRVADQESAEDILQDVFLKIHTHVATLRTEDKLESWVYQITRNLIIDYYRRKTPAMTSWDEMEMPELLEDLPEEDARTTIVPALFSMVNCLPAASREALLLTDYQGLSQKDLSLRLGISFSGAKSRVQRARERVKQLLLECCHFEFDRLGRVIDYQPRCSCCAASCESGCADSSCGPECAQA